MTRKYNTKITHAEDITQNLNRGKYSTQKITRKYNKKIQQSNTTHHLFLFFTTRIQNNTNHAIKHII